MRESLYLAWRYLAHHRGKTAILVTSIMLIVYLPVGLNAVVGQSAAQLTARAEATPLLVGAPGSPLELVLNSLYLESAPPVETQWSQLLAVEESGLARAIPLHVRFASRGHPIVGTALEYLDFRGLRLAEGRRFALLGECVVGARAARALGVGPGDAVVSSPEGVLDLAGVYPLKLRVVGVLEPSHGPDDRAVFVDVKTAWVIAGLWHGHRDLSTPESASDVLRREEGRIVANAAVVQYNEITAENAGTFHFHGELGEHPLTAVIAVPHDERSGVILRGRYAGDGRGAQIVRPVEVMDELLATVLTIRSYVVTAAVMVGAATLATAALVFALSLRLRRREIETMVKIGASRGRIVAVLATEVASVLVASAVLAGLLSLLTRRFASEAIRAVLLS